MLHCDISFVQHVRHAQCWHLIKGANFPLRRRVRFPHPPLKLHRSFREPDANTIADFYDSSSINCAPWKPTMPPRRGGEQFSGPRGGDIYPYPKQRSPLRGELWEMRTAEDGKEGRTCLLRKRGARAQGGTIVLPPLGAKIILPFAQC